MVVNAIYHGLNQVHRVYHGGQMIFQRDPIQFHIIDGDKLIIVGALAMLPVGDALYLDCSPDSSWTYPELKNGVLTIRQAHTATPNGTTLEVR